MASNAGTFKIVSPSIVLSTESNSVRAIALDSVTLVRESFPFRLRRNNLSRIVERDHVLLSKPCIGFRRQFSSVSAQAEDAHISLSLDIEFIGKTSHMIGFTDVIKLPDQLGTSMRSGEHQLFEEP